jgi:peptide/nickel transport system permease protein
VRKLASIGVTVFIIMSVIFVTFMAMQGDPRFYLVPKGMSYDLTERIVEEMCLDQPLYVQFADYLVDTITGDFRISTAVATGYDVQDFIWKYVTHTIALLSLGLLGSLSVAAVLELFVTRRAKKGASIAAHAISLIFMSIPAFVLALAILYINAGLDLGLPLFGDGTRTHLDDEPSAITLVKHAILPVLTVVLLSTGFAVVILREGARVSRRDGDGEKTTLRSLATGLVALRPMMHFHVAWTMSIVMAVDLVFAYGGLGRLVFDAIVRRDYPTLMAALFLSAMIVLAAGIIVSTAVNVIARSRNEVAFSDWGRRIPREAKETPAVARESTSWQSWFVSLWKDYRASATGLAAIAILVILTVLGVLAPVLSTVPDPMDMNNAEPPLFPDWDNPLPPSLDPSPYTDLLHPLGTDRLGRDVYSMWLYSARDAVATALLLLIGSVAVGLVVGLLAVNTVFITGFPARLLDFFLTTGARAAIALPITAFVAVRMMLFEAENMVFAIPMLLAAFYAWAWMLVLRPVRRTAMSASGPVSGAWMTPPVIAETLSVTKFAVPLLLIAYFSLFMTGYGTPGDLTWSTTIYDAYMWGAFLSGEWFLIFPPVIGMSLMVIGLFAALDTAESVVRRNTSYPSSNV